MSDDQREKPPSSDGFVLDYGMPEVSLDARATARVTRVAPSTFNVWISRGLFPGVTIGAHGRARAFSGNLLYHLAVTAALVRLGYGAPEASVAVKDAHRRDAAGPGQWLVIGPLELAGFPQPRSVYVIKDGLAEIDRVLPDAEGYTVVNIGAIWTRVLAALAESKEPTAGPKPEGEEA
jgi:hypothetical protein